MIIDNITSSKLNAWKAIFNAISAYLMFVIEIGYINIPYRLDVSTMQWTAHQPYILFQRSKIEFHTKTVMLVFYSVYDTVQCV